MEGTGVSGMTVNLPQAAGSGDLSRTQSIEPNQDWPTLVQIVVAWQQPDGSIAQRTRTILADEFYGRGRFGAPMPAEALALAVEQMRREGPPPKPGKIKHAPAARKTPAKGKRR
jgi:hypothetical protein